MPTQDNKKKGSRLVIVIIIVAIVIAIVLSYFVYFSCMLKKKNNPDESPSIVTSTCISKKGRLGNQLFQIATVLGTAKRNKCKYIFPEEIENAYSLSLIDSSNLVIGKVRINYTIKEEDESTYIPISFPEDGRTYDLDGYYQSHLYFNCVEDELRKLLKPREKWLFEARTRVKTLSEEHTIGVHIRRGDYLNKEYIDLYAHPTVDYYISAIELISDKIRRSGYNGKIYIVICSDDPTWCKNNIVTKLPKSYDIYIGEGKKEDQYVEFSMLYLCRHQVMANSSYSWWTVFLKPVVEGRKLIDRTIVAPYPWYNLKGPDAGKQSDNIYYPEWTILDYQKTRPIRRFKDRTERLWGLYAHRMESGKEGETWNGYDEEFTNTMRKVGYKGEKKKKLIRCKDFPDQRKSHGIDVAYIINMSNQPERWDNSSKLLKHVGLNPVRFPAVDKDVIKSFGGREGLKKLSLIDEQDKNLDSEGTIGCGLSHMSIWAEIAEHSDARAAIFEDDIAGYINREDLIQKLNDARNVMPPDWDLLFLGRCIDSCHESVRIADGLYKTKRPYCTHAYIISSRGARKLLSRALYTGVDTQIVRDVEIDALKAYTFHPSIYVQDIVRWTSNLRSFGLQVTNCYDCDKPK